MSRLAVLRLTIVASCLLICLPAPGQRALGNTGWLEVRVSDHRPGITDFAALWVTVEQVALHIRGQPRREGWVEVVLHTEPVDIVPLKDGRWSPLGAWRVAARRYDAVRVRFGDVRSVLHNDTHAEVAPLDATVAVDVGVAPGGNSAILLDLYVEDQSDHEPGRYAVKVRGVRALSP